MAGCSKDSTKPAPFVPQPPIDHPPSLYLYSGSAPESSLLTIEVTAKDGDGDPMDSLVLDTSSLPPGNDARLDTTGATAQWGLYDLHWTTGPIGVYPISLTVYSSGGSAHGDASLYVVGGDTAAADARVSIGSLCYPGPCSPFYVPDPLTIHVGQRIAFDCYGDDRTVHTATQDGGGFDTHLIPALGSSGSFLFTEPDTVHYHCALHPSEQGTIYVVP